MSESTEETLYAYAVESTMRKKLDDRDRQLAIARETIHRLEGEVHDFGTRLRLAQMTTMAATRTAHVALMRLQSASRVAEQARALLTKLTHLQVSNLGARPLLDASYAYELLLKGAS